MFTSARIRLTAWYLCIIMLISIMFSFSIYRILTTELERGFHRIEQRYFQEYGPIPSQALPQILEPSYLQASEDHIKWVLIYINLIIFAVSGIGGYVLAGFTLKPIKKMLDEQNRFVADASHELNTPLTVLRSEIEVYLREKKPTEEETKLLLQSNLEEVNNLQYLINSLINLAHHDSHFSEDHFGKVSIQEVLGIAIGKVGKQAKHKKINIVTDFQQESEVLGSKEKLIQLFAIILDNALKYSPKNTKISVETVTSDKNIKISISDEGMGIEEKDIPHIFDRFYRADMSRTKQEISGYGLGLSIAKNIVEEHHGSIQVESEKEKGTKFTVFFQKI